MQLSPDGRTAANHTVFADGWLPAGGTSGEQAWGRPVGLLRLPDGSMLVADDKAQVVYRIGPGIVTTNGGGSTTPAAGTALLALLAAACMLLL